MGIWFIIFIVAAVALFFIYIHYLKKYPILYLPFDYPYRVFKRAYRAYTPVREGKKLYKVFAEDFLCGHKRILEGKIKANAQEYLVANRVCNIFENHRERVERYFSQKFGYSDYLNLNSEYDLFQEQVIEAKNQEDTAEQVKFQRPLTLRRKVLIFESLLRVCNVDASKAHKARFIRDLLEVEPRTKEIGNTNTYKFLKDNQNEVFGKKQILSRIGDYEYVAEQLHDLGLERERTVIMNEINELKGSILD